MLVDITNLIAYRDAALKTGRTISLSSMLYYVVGYGVNTIEEFRYRLVDNEPVIFSEINTAFTHIPAGKSLHYNYSIEFNKRFSLYEKNIADSIQNTHPTLTPTTHKHPQCTSYISNNHRINFTHFTNVWGHAKEDSVPRFAFGKFEKKTNNAVLMPLNIEVLHCFVDGKHIADFLELFAEIVSQPERYFS